VTFKKHDIWRQSFTVDEKKNVPPPIQFIVLFPIFTRVGTFWNKMTSFGHDWLLCCCEQLISWAGQQISDQTIEIKTSENLPNDTLPCQYHLKTQC
jgi:hypothetical protein